MKRVVAIWSVSNAREKELRKTAKAWGFKTVGKYIASFVDVKFNVKGTKRRAKS